MKIKVSVIVPVYNVEKFIDKCLNSIVNQTLKEIEIIVAISLSIIQILKKDLLEIKDVYKYKNLKINVKNIKHSMVIFFIGIIKRTNQIDEALIAKGKRY